MIKRRTALAAALVLIVQVLLGGLSAPAHAYVGPADDRQKTTPTGWWFYTNVDATFINNHVSANNSRITEIRVLTASPLRFTVTLVKNSGAYATPWWWYYGATTTSVSNALSANSARLISAHAYNTTSGMRFAVVMVRNTGTYAEPWWWYQGSVSTISSKLSANSARLIHLHRMPNGNYLGIMVRNTGSTEATAWWWYVNASTSQVSSYLSNNGAYLVDLDRNSNGTFNVVMYKNTGSRYWWWYVNMSATGLLNRAVQLGARLVDVTPYVVGGVTYYAGIMVNNLNAASTKLAALMRAKVDSGKYGFYLKHVGGGQLAGLQERAAYEPASALKVLYHAKTIHEEALGNWADSNVVTYHYRSGDPTNKDICPQDADPTTTTNLKDADERMMWYSDNRMTRAILEKAGGATPMETYGQSLGMSATTQINHHIGCATPHNYTTLYDLGRVYETFQNGTVTSNATWQANFRSRMLNQGNSSYDNNYICPVVQQEAASLGKSTTVANSFCANVKWISKGGSYQYGGSLPYTVSWDSVSLTSLPYKSSGTIAPRHFVFGDFVDGTTINSTTESSAVSSVLNKVFQEALRPYIRSALTTW